MPRQPSKAAKVSLYRLALKANYDLTLGVQKKYLETDQFETNRTEISGSEGLLVHGTIPNDRPRWVEHAVSVSSVQFTVSNQTSAGLLLIRLKDKDDHCYCLSWSMGHLLINSTYVDDGFGLRFALRKSDPEEVRALTSHALDTVPRTARTSVIGGAPLDSFGLEEIGEIVSRFVGRIEADGLTCDIKPSTTRVGTAKAASPNRKITVRGADALGIPLAKSPSELLADLQLIDAVVNNDDPRDELRHLENTQPLRPGNGKIPDLEKLLAKELRPTGSSLALCWPAEFDEEPGEIAQYKVVGTGSGKAQYYDELEIDCLVSPLGDLDPDLRIKRLRLMKIQGQADDGSALTREISGEKWLMYQTDMEGGTYVLHRGRWYNIGGAYLEMLRGRLERIFSKTYDTELPKWPKQNKRHKSNGEGYVGWANEAIYNDDVVGQIQGYVSLDRRMIKTTQHPRGFESCDFLTPDDRLVHVKRLDDSVAASHLFNQAANSAEALTRQADAREKFREKVYEISEGKRALPDNFRPKAIVLAFAGRSASPDDLFTFSQVSLSRCAQRIDGLGLTLEIAHIDESDEIVAS